jgi:hypothetical protein
MSPEHTMPGQSLVVSNNTYLKSNQTNQGESHPQACQLGIFARGHKKGNMACRHLDDYRAHFPYQGSVHNYMQKASDYGT